MCNLFVASPGGSVTRLIELTGVSIPVRATVEEALAAIRSDAAKRAVPRRPGRSDSDP